MVKYTNEREDERKEQTFGSLQLRNKETNQIILIPTPSNDPNDPLNWSRGFKFYVALLTCFGQVMCNWLAAGPTVAIVETAMDFFPDWKSDGPMGLPNAISKTAYFFTSSALCQGVGMFFWMPIINKYGRRPVYLISFSLYFITAIWTSVSTNYTCMLVGRIVLGLAAGAGECVAPLTISDVFFLHERGKIMGMYNAALSCGVGGGIIIAGLITINHSWRYIYYVSIALIGFLVILVFFTLPETLWNRSPHPSKGVTTDFEKPSVLFESDNKARSGDHIEDVINIPQKRTWIQNLKIFHGSFTEESLITMGIRPFGLILFPNILWATLVMSVTIGFIVAITSNVAPAFAKAYNFKAWQSGLCFIAAIIGALLGILFGGTLSDWVADFFTKRNGGHREPEMRLPAILISVVCAPAALLFYGLGIQYQAHWIVPTLGIAFINFAIVQATNVSLVYTIDSYRPIAGEVVVTQLAFKACFGFLLSFYTNPWVDKHGYAAAFGEMAGISGGVLLLFIPFYIWGKSIRQATWRWKIMKFVHWDEDREVGE